MACEGVLCSSGTLTHKQPWATLWQRRPLRSCGRILLDLWAACARTWSKRTHPRMRFATQSHVCFFVVVFFNSTRIFFSPPATPGLDQHKRGSENLGEEIEDYYWKIFKLDLKIINHHKKKTVLGGLEQASTIISFVARDLTIRYKCCFATKRKKIR